MKQIRITRNAGAVNFGTVNIDRTENVFFINLDSQAEHWPDLISNKLGPAPSPPSSQATPDPTGTKAQVIYGCRIVGHGTEKGIINIFEPLAAGTTTLGPVVHGGAITDQVVQGGMSPYQISNQLFEIVDAGGTVIHSGSGSIGPGLRLFPSTDNTGIILKGNPSVVGTYNFTFEVDDGMGSNLQQVQYSMKVT